MTDIKTAKKYKLTDETIQVGGHTLHRIEALTDFSNAHKGEKGGFVESEDNLSQSNDCWVYDEGACDGSQKYIDFICEIDGCKMYSNKIHRLSSDKAKQIKERCDRPMPDATKECANYEYDNENQ